jgi:hypothetical protein
MTVSKHENGVISMRIDQGWKVSTDTRVPSFASSQAAGRARPRVDGLLSSRAPHTRGTIERANRHEGRLGYAVCSRLGQATCRAADLQSSGSAAQRRRGSAVCNLLQANGLWCVMR